MRSCLFGWAVLACSVVSLPVFAGGVSVGSTRAEVVGAYGQPSGEMNFEGKTTLFYPGGEVVLENGKVVEIPAELRKKNKAALEEKARREAEAAAARQESDKRKPAPTSAGDGSRPPSKSTNITTVTITCKDLKSLRDKARDKAVKEQQAARRPLSAKK